MADQSYLFVNTSAPPVLGRQFWGATIYPVDADGDAVSQGDQNFAVSFSAKSGKSTYYANCQPDWSDVVHLACDMPNVDQTLGWRLVVTLGGEVIVDGNQTVAVACDAGEFDLRGACASCLGGATCDEPGLALATLPLNPGRWRQDSESTHVRKCLFDEARERRGDDPRRASRSALWRKNELESNVDDLSTPVGR